MKLLSSVLVISFLFGSVSAQAEYGDTNKVTTLFDYTNDKVRYVTTFSESLKWKVLVTEATGDGLEQPVTVQDAASQDEAKKLHTKLVATAKDAGYVNPLETATVLDDDADALPVVEGDADLAVLTSGPSANEGNNPIWQVGSNRWNWDAELAFAKWVKSLDRFFFVKNRIPTDCADVVISLRWIFSFMHKLPVANTLTSSGKLVGHMTEDPLWSSLDNSNPDWTKNARFQKALEYIKEMTYTGSLKRDSYPIKIHRDILIPGVHHLEFHSEGGHAMIVADVEVSRSKAEITVMDSTLPVEIRKLGRKKYTYGKQPDEGTGFLRLKTLEKDGNTWYVKYAEEHPDWSPEQYSSEFMGFQTQFVSAVEVKLTGKQDVFSQKNWEESLKVIRFKFMERRLAVLAGIEACQQINCAKGTEGWEEYSTPGRDKKIKNDVEAAVKTIQLQQNNRNAVNAWNKFLRDTLDLDNRGGYKVTLETLVQNVLEDKMNPDPRVSLAERWGI